MRFDKLRMRSGQLRMRDGQFRMRDGQFRIRGGRFRIGFDNLGMRPSLNPSPLLRGGSGEKGNVISLNTAPSVQTPSA